MQLPAAIRVLPPKGRFRNGGLRWPRTKGASKKGGKAEPYEDGNKDDRYDRAKEIGIEGRSDMSKPQLVKALRNH